MTWPVGWQLTSSEPLLVDVRGAGDLAALVERVTVAAWRMMACDRQSASCKRGPGKK
jgi:hypothetical protein